MRILVTGSSGMLGSAMMRQLKKFNHEILSPSSSELNLENQLKTHKYVKEFKPDTIIHCAALVGGIQANISNPIDYLSVNIRMDSNLLTAASNIDTKNLVYIGSSCMYPKNLNVTLTEDLIGTGRLEETNEGYALAKIVGAKTVSLNAKIKNLNWRSVILSNLYGPGDHFEPNRSHLVAAIIEKVVQAKKSGNPKIEMWGDGKAKREFTYVDDVASFIAERIDSLPSFPDMMNLGAGYDLSVHKYYELVANLCDYKGSIEMNLLKPSGMRNKLMDVSKAKSIGWNPQTTLEDGLRQTINWYLGNVK